MTDPIDALEHRARTCLESGAGLIEPSAVLELIGRLRDAERVAAPIPGLDDSPGSVAMSERSLVNLLNLACARLPPPGLRQQAYLELQERFCRIENERRASKLAAPTADDACSCDESLALQARVRELEERNAAQARTIGVLDHMLADDPEFCSEPEAKLRMAKLKLGAWLVAHQNATHFQRSEGNSWTIALYTRCHESADIIGYGDSEAAAIFDALKKAGVE